MSTLTVRIQKRDHQILKSIAAETGEAMSETLAKAIEDYRRKVFLARLSDDFSRLRGDEQGWQEELEERRAWEGTLGDGLEGDEFEDTPR